MMPGLALISLPQAGTEPLCSQFMTDSVLYSRVAAKAVWICGWAVRERGSILSCNLVFSIHSRSFSEAFTQGAPAWNKARLYASDAE